MKILSIFDGISCGQVALKRAKIPVETYYASEIDKYAIKITQKNFPKTIQLGDVQNWKQWKLPKIDLIMGGSPCQGFSNAGKGLNFNDPRSKLFFTFIDILNHYKPKWFLLENVKMKKEWQDIITKELGVEPVLIDSALVSAQKRQRLYWFNWKVKQPRDRKKNINDLINTTLNLKEVGCWRKYHDKDKSLFVDPYNQSKLTTKSNTLRTNVSNGNMWVRMPNGKYRNLTVNETELLQTLPKNYTVNCEVSDNKSKMAISNGWTVEVIKHILRGIK